MTVCRSREAFLRNTFICEPKEYDLYGLESKPAGGSSLSCNLSLNNNTISRNCYNPFLRQRWIFQKLLQGIKCCVVNSSRGIVEKEKRNKPKGSSYVISCLSGYTLVVYRGKLYQMNLFWWAKALDKLEVKNIKSKVGMYLFLKSVGRMSSQMKLPDYKLWKKQTFYHWLLYGIQTYTSYEKLIKYSV